MRCTCKKRKPKPEGFGKKPEGFKEKISKSWENRIVTWGDKISKGNKGLSSLFEVQYQKPSVF